MKLMRINNPDFWATSPMGALTTLQQEINRLFDSPFGGLDRSGEFFHDWAPALDLIEDNDNLMAQLELPGVAKKDVEVSVHDGVLSVSGERKQESETKDEGCFRRERFHGRFNRSVTLPKPVKTDAIKATLKDGILTVTMPKTEEARPRQIEVNQG
jgi:HSP20 family protein